ncbi:MAG: 30S ribosomal protein S15 [Candidatus Hydrothermarchaeaceae archaeon]
MSRMHSGKKGKSGSVRPYAKAPPKWIEHSTEEVEELVVKLANKGMASSAIGVALRDQYGVPSVNMLAKKRVNEILEERGIKREIPEDLMNLLRKAVNLDRHRIEKPQDMVSKRGVQLVEAKIRRLVKYYKREGKLPVDWKYDLATAKLLVE